MKVLKKFGEKLLNLVPLFCFQHNIIFELTICQKTGPAKTESHVNEYYCLFLQQTRVIAGK